LSRTSLPHDWRPSPNGGARRDGKRADILLLHYTGMASAEAACRWLCNPDSGVSCHYLVDEHGGIVQMVEEAPTHETRIQNYAERWADDLVPYSFAGAGACSFLAGSLDRAAAVLAQIDYPWEELGFELRFLPPRDGIRGMTFPDRRRIELYVRLSDPLARTAHDLAHEIGHAVDLTVMDRSRRGEWAERRGYDRSTPWWPCPRCEDRGTGAGDYAEVFALWQVGGRYFSSQLAPAPSADELAELVAYFWPPQEEERDEEEERGPLVPCVVSCR
jgi:hypothetical protein